jgi:hypothetical protein
MTGGFGECRVAVEPSRTGTDPIENFGTTGRDHPSYWIATTDFVDRRSIPVVMAHRFEHEAPRVELQPGLVPRVRGLL